ncbi:MAG: hypothetical protein WDM70_00365 [Nitrosomonadales bacterium]
MFALGELSNQAVREFGAGARHFERIEDLLDALDKELDTDCTVLIKVRASCVWSGWYSTAAVTRYWRSQPVAGAAARPLH